MLQESDMEQIGKFIRQIVREELSNKHLTPIEAQLRRCELTQEQMGLENIACDNSNNNIKDPEIERKIREVEAELDRVANPITDPDLQQIVDTFDFDYCVEVARREGWKYRDQPITKEDIIGDALECAKDIRDVLSGRTQRGRLVICKMYDFKEKESWYSMAFIAEHGESF